MEMANEKRSYFYCKECGKRYLYVNGLHSRCMCGGVLVVVDLLGVNDEEV